MLGYNPLPISVKVFINEEDFDFSKVDLLIKSLSNIDFVDEVEYRGRYIDEVEDRINLAIFLFLVFVVAIIFLSYQIISNTVNLSMTNRKDFGEGIEAVLIKKHHNPKWTPSSINEINKKELQNLFD